MIRFAYVLLLVTLVVSLPAMGQSRDVYTVRGIEVDERAPTVLEAQQKAFAAAKLEGVRILIDRITLPEDRISSTDLIIDQPTADLMAAAVDVEEEVAGAGRYRGSLAVVFNPANVRRVLQDASVPFTDRQAPKAVLLTISSAGNAVAWNMAWDDTSEGRLVPTVTSRTLGISETSIWADLENEVVLYDAQRAVLASLEGFPGQYRANVSSVTPSGVREIGRTRASRTLEGAIDAVGDLLDEDWKRTSIVREAERTLIEATVLYTSLTEWNTLRGALIRSPLVSDVQTRAISTDGAVVRFAFAGDGERLVSDLRDRGVSIDLQPIGWVMTSAVSSFVD